jgi:hypothetical protein
LPKKGFTCITISNHLKDELKQTAKERGYKNIPQLLRAITSKKEKITSKKVTPNQASFPKLWCGEWDSNPRTPTGQPPQGCAFDLAWQPPHT